MMKKLLCAMAVWMCATSAHAEIWQCIDKETGEKRYTNIERDTKGCHLMKLHVSKTPASEASAKPAVKPRPVAQANGFPSVDRDTQRSRDEERRHILEQELAEEERLLAEAQNAGSGDSKTQHAVELHQENIDNLRKEIASIK